jgi:hypothetical protein
MLKRHRIISLCILVTVVVGGCQGSGKVPISVPASTAGLEAKVDIITTGKILVPAGKWSQLVFDVSKSNMTNVVVNGWAHASGGPQNDIEVFIVKDDDYTTWTQGRQVTPFYNSGRKTIIEMNVNMPAATERYHLVFNNVFSTSMKTIQSEVYLKYFVKVTPTPTTSPVSANTTAPG